MMNMMKNQKVKKEDVPFNKLFTHLPFFIEVASSGSELKAAEILGIGQPTVSYHVNALEKKLGIKLFIKNGNGLSLTEMGVNLYNITRRFQNNVASLLNKWRKSATIRVGVTPPIYPIIAELIKSNYFSEYKASFHLETHSSGENIHLLFKNELDICFTGSTDFGELRARRDLVILPVINDELVAISSARYNIFEGRRFISIQELRDYPCAVRDTNSATYAATLTMFGKVNIAPQELKVVYIGKDFYDIIKFLDTYPAYSVVSRLQLNLNKNLKNIYIVKLTPRVFAKRSIFVLYKGEGVANLVAKLAFALRRNYYSGS